MNPAETFEQLLKEVQAYLPGENPELLHKAFLFSHLSHQEQKRAGGDPFIVHPLAVARTLADMHMDIPTLAAGLLHDVLEDTSCTRENFRKEFGDEILHLVEGVTKIDSMEHLAPNPSLKDLFSSNPEIIRQAENWRKMMIATAQDIRVILLKLADRKHNMETLEFLAPEKRKKIAEETISLYAPLAQRMGMYQLKSQLEDLSFKFLEPEIYAELDAKISAVREHRKEFLDRCVKKIESMLAEHPYSYRISARPKNIYSVYRKMVRQNKTFEEIQDLAGIRIITDSVEHCYALLGVIHTNFVPVAETFTDYISMPKTNLYQSLHTTVNLPGNEIVEVQIRTEEMHHICEFGLAAHYRYKQTGGGAYKNRTVADSVDDKLDWIKRILEWQQETDHPKDFLDGLRTELEFDQIFVFTPKGKVIKLPAGSTPVDFAYAVHTDLGNQCMGAKVNDKMVRLDTHLKSGDRCEILTRKGQEPHKDWLEFVKTPRARSKIRKVLKDKGKA